MLALVIAVMNEKQTRNETLMGEDWVIPYQLN